MRIAIFDYLVTRTNPAGSCHRVLLARLAERHEFTVFAPRFDNPDPARVSWIRTPALCRPLAALFVTFHITGLLGYLCNLWRRKFAVVQSVESNLSFGNLVYMHFCHRWFLRHKWKSCRPQGPRRVFAWLDHALHAALEPWAMRRARWIVAASPGLAREIAQEYPFAAAKVRIICNPVDADYYAPRAESGHEQLRASLGAAVGETLVVFVALGHFERKGLPILLTALSALRHLPIKLCVVGGSASLVSKYRRRAEEVGISTSVSFVGFQADIRPYLWAADLVALPSLYEVFPLAILQAAAAGRPILVTPHAGAEPLAGGGCIMVEPTPADVAAKLAAFCRISPEERLTLGRQARAAASNYHVEKFVSEWTQMYQEISQAGANG